MEVARKYVQPLPQQPEIQSPSPRKKKAPKKSFQLQRALVVVGLLCGLALGLTLLLRYANMIQLRHTLHTQSQRIQELEMQREKTRITYESISKSRVIEEEAINRLEMRYPSREDTLYISVDPAKVALLTEELNLRMGQVEEPEASVGLMGRLLQQIRVSLEQMTQSLKSTASSIL